MRPPLAPRTRIARKAHRCRIAGLLFLLIAALVAATIPLAGLWPAPRSHCGDQGCTWSSDPVTLFDEQDAEKLRAAPADSQRLKVYVQRPLIRLGLAGIEAIDVGPLVVLLVAVGIALRRLGGPPRDAFAQALPWLRRATIAAILWAIAQPLSDSLRQMLLYRGTSWGPHWLIALDFNAMAMPLLLSLAAYAAVWALESGLQAQRDLDDFV